MKTSVGLTALPLLVAATIASADDSESLTITMGNRNFCGLTLESSTARIDRSILRHDGNRTRKIDVGILNVACNDRQGFVLSVSSNNNFELREADQSDGRRKGRGNHRVGVPYALVARLPSGDRDRRSRPVLLDTRRGRWGQRFRAINSGLFGDVGGQDLILLIDARNRRTAKRRVDREHDDGVLTDTITFVIAPDSLSRSGPS